METVGTAASAKGIKQELKPKKQAKPVSFKEIADKYLAEHLSAGDLDEYFRQHKAGQVLSFYT